MNKDLEGIVDVANELTAQWTEFAVFWRSTGLPLNKKYAPFENKNFEEYNCIVIEIIKIFTYANKIGDYSLDLMLPRVDEINMHLADARTSIADLLVDFRSHPNAKFKVAGGSLSSIQGFVNGELVVVINMKNHLSNLDAAFSRALRAGTWW